MFQHSSVSYSSAHSDVIRPSDSTDYRLNLQTVTPCSQSSDAKSMPMCSSHIHHPCIIYYPSLRIQVQEQGHITEQLTGYQQRFPHWFLVFDLLEQFIELRYILFRNVSVEKSRFLVGTYTGSLFYHCHIICQLHRAGPWGCKWERIQTLTLSASLQVCQLGSFPSPDL